MKARCTNPLRDGYQNYGGRGISFDPRWATFEAFLEDMGPRLTGHDLDRYPNPDGNYCLDNCRWWPSSENRGRKRWNPPP